MVAGKIAYETGFNDKRGKAKTDEATFCFVYTADTSVPWNACPVVTFADLQKMGTKGQQ
jgi:hypothetical protein